MIRFVILSLAAIFTFISLSLAYAEPMSGLFCGLQESAERVATAYDHGGYDEEDSVASSLVSEGKCARVDDPIDVSVVYHGKIIGKKAIVGVSRYREGAPEFFGVVDYPGQDRSI